MVVYSVTCTLYPAFPVRDRNQSCRSTAGSAAVGLAPDARLSTLPTSLPLRRHKLNRKGRIDRPKASWVKGMLGKSELFPKRKASTG